MSHGTSGKVKVFESLSPNTAIPRWTIDGRRLARAHAANQRLPTRVAATKRNNLTSSLLLAIPCRSIPFKINTRYNSHWLSEHSSRLSMPRPLNHDYSDTMEARSPVSHPDFTQFFGRIAMCATCAIWQSLWRRAMEQGLVWLLFTVHVWLDLNSYLTYVSQHV